MLKEARKQVCGKAATSDSLKTSLTDKQEVRGGGMGIKVSEERRKLLAQRFNYTVLIPCFMHYWYSGS